MASGAIRRYWDSAACLAYLAEEPGRVEGCQLVLDAAEASKIEIVISALTISEVLLLRGHNAIPKDRSEMVRRFFRRSFFVVVDVDRYIAESAQDLVWDHGIKPKDAIHVATAVTEQVPIMDTYDDALIGRSGQVGGDPVLIIGHPGDGMQAELDLDNSPHRSRP